MDVDDDSDDNHGNDAGMGFLGSIVPDEDDDVSDMLLAQVGSIPPKKYGTPSRPMPSNPHPTQTLSDFHGEVVSFIANQALSSLGKSHARDERQAVRRIMNEI